MLLDRLQDLSLLEKVATTRWGRKDSLTSSQKHTGVDGAATGVVTDKGAADAAIKEGQTELQDGGLAVAAETEGEGDQGILHEAAGGGGVQGDGEGSGVVVGAAGGGGVQGDGEGSSVVMGAAGGGGVQGEIKGGLGPIQVLEGNAQEPYRCAWPGCCVVEEVREC